MIRQLRSCLWERFKTKPYSNSTDNWFYYSMFAKIKKREKKWLRQKMRQKGKKKKSSLQTSREGLQIKHIKLLKDSNCLPLIFPWKGRAMIELFILVGLRFRSQNFTQWNSNLITQELDRRIHLQIMCKYYIPYIQVWNVNIYLLRDVLQWTFIL